MVYNEKTNFMIGALRGIVHFKRFDRMILMVNGIGYVVYPPNELLSTIKLGETLEVYIHTHVREDSLQLFGFATSRELELFELLLGVSGIGPKTALAIVNRGADQVYQALSGADVTFFTTIPRLGTKNAQKIIIELKSKINSIKELDLTQSEDGQSQELLDALTHFGFTREEVVKVLGHLPNTQESMAQKIKWALKYLGSTHK